jgi:RNA ligase
MEFKLQDFLELTKIKEEIRMKEEIVNGVRVGIFSYMVSMPDTFDSDLAKECRGITFNLETGECICRPFPKFFNVNEKPGWLEHELDWKNITYVGEKFDGSMITPVLVNGKVFLKTKKSFYSDVAIQATQYMNKNNIVFDFKKDETLLLEYIGPDNKIVIDYPQEKFVSLAVRNINSGKITFTTNIFDECKNLIQDGLFIEYVRTLVGKEGFVCYDATNDKLFKVKSQWYMDLHRLIDKISGRDVLVMILDETIDDYSSAIAENKRKYNAIAELTKEVNQFKLQLIKRVEKTYMENCALSKKEFAQHIFANGHKDISGILFALYDQKDYMIQINGFVNNVYREKLSGVIF